MNIPKEYAVCDPDYRGGGGLAEDVGLLRDFVRTIKSLEAEHHICLTSLDSEAKVKFEQLCKPLLDYLYME